jgi:hypothetical protein
MPTFELGERIDLTGVPLEAIEELPSDFIKHLTITEIRKIKPSMEIFRDKIQNKDAIFTEGTLYEKSVIKREAAKLGVKNLESVRDPFEGLMILLDNRFKATIFSIKGADFLIKSKFKNIELYRKSSVTLATISLKNFAIEHQEVIKQFKEEKMTIEKIENAEKRASYAIDYVKSMPTSVKEVIKRIIASESIF